MRKSLRARVAAPEHGRRLGAHFFSTREPLDMSNPFLVRLAHSMRAALALALLIQCAVGAEPSPEAARLDTYAHPDGTTYFALSLRPGVIPPARTAPDVVGMVDTSASQTAEFRAEALDALRGTLANLSPADRVHLMAVDLNA